MDNRIANDASLSVSVKRNQKHKRKRQARRHMISYSVTNKENKQHLTRWNKQKRRRISSAVKSGPECSHEELSFGAMNVDGTNEAVCIALEELLIKRKFDVSIRIRIFDKTGHPC